MSILRWITEESISFEFGYWMNFPFKNFCNIVYQHKVWSLKLEDIDSLDLKADSIIDNWNTI